MKKMIPITLIRGDGIGPEVVDVTTKMIEATGAPITWQTCEAGAEVFKKGLASGVPQETLASIRQTRIVLKGPLETPVGFGEKSANVTLRKLFETFANVRPVREFPGVETPFKGRNIDLVIVRENVEDLYAGVEYMQTASMAEGLKIITRKGCEKIIRFAFELARAEKRKKVHCATKANIMKFTEGMMKRTFEEVAPDYSEIEAHHIIIDNCAHQMVRFPENFDIIVTTNMNGDIISDLASGLVGGLGLAPSANYGHDIAIFEAVHGSAPKYAGKNIANPTAVLLSGIMLLRHLDLFENATALEQSLMRTLGHDKAFTQDLAKQNDSQALSTSEFTDRIIDNLGKSWQGYRPRSYQPINMPKTPELPQRLKQRVVGVDVFIETREDPESIGQQLAQILEGSDFKLKLISSRGVIVYPHPGNHPDLGDCFSCRFMLKSNQDNLEQSVIIDLLNRIGTRYNWVHVEKMTEFNGEPGFSKAQGES
ncbi:MAG: NADP-dependent isocitrate dehydrogenase [Pseudomonadota bacterium]